MYMYMYVTIYMYMYMIYDMYMYVCKKSLFTCKLIDYAKHNILNSSESTRIRDGIRASSYKDSRFNSTSVSSE